MNYIKHLTGFFNCIANEEIIYPTHISLYLALFQSWNVNRFKNPITISREEMMKASRIASKATYHKCIKELQLIGFIEYLPSYNPYYGTEVIMHNLSDGNKRSSSIVNTSKPINEQVNGQVTEQVIEPHIYNNKQTFKNNKNISIDGKFEEIAEDGYLETAGKEKKVPRKKKEKPGLEQVKEYFNAEGYPELEAERFFNYYTSNGWLIGGKTEMVDWNAGARNWMLTTSKFSINSPQNKEKIRANNLHTEVDKDYAEPL